MIKYHLAPDVDYKVSEIVQKLGLKHIKKDVLCLRSYGSKARKSLARTYRLSHENQKAMGVSARYAVEVISENFDSLPAHAKTKTLIHELLHIADSPEDAFLSHKDISREKVEKLYKTMRRQS